jgi:hypothetical protein
MRKVLIFLIVFQAAGWAETDRLAELWRRVYDVSVAGQWAATGTDAGVRLFRCVGSKCQETDRFQTPDAVAAVAFLDSKTLVAGGGQGLWILKVQDDGKLKLQHQLKASGAIRGFSVGQELAGAAMGAMGIEVYRRGGGRLIPQNLYPTQDYCRSVDLVGQTLYAACGYDGLIVLDLARPMTPKRVGKLDFKGEIRSVKVYGTKGLVGLGRAGVGVIDLSAPDRPALLFQAAVKDGGRFAVMYGDHVYVADGMKGIAVFRLGTKGLEKTGQVNFYGAPVRMVIDGSRLYVAADYGGLVVFDLTDPDKPRLVWPK